MKLTLTYFELIDLLCEHLAIPDDIDLELEIEDIPLKKTTGRTPEDAKTYVGFDPEAKGKPFQWTFKDETEWVNLDSDPVKMAEKTSDLVAKRLSEWRLRPEPIPEFPPAPQGPQEDDKDAIIAELRAEIAKASEPPPPTREEQVNAAMANVEEFPDMPDRRLVKAAERKLSLGSALSDYDQKVLQAWADWSSLTQRLSVYNELENLTVEEEAWSKAFNQHLAKQAMGKAPRNQSASYRGKWE